MSSNLLKTKFKFNLKFSPPLHEDNYLNLEKWRIILYRMNVIGINKSNKVSFGDLSKRILVGENQFIITGADTGRYGNLDGGQYTRLVKCDLKKMTMEASGPIAPSADSHIHYLLYKVCPQINFIFQLKHQELWEYLLNNDRDKLEDPFNKDFEAAEISITTTIGEKSAGIVALSQLENVIITYGPTAEIAGKIFLDTLKDSKN